MLKLQKAGKTALKYNQTYLTIIRKKIMTTRQKNMFTKSNVSEAKLGTWIKPTKPIDLPSRNDQLKRNSSYNC